jgi:hypothetical protein
MVALSEKIGQPFDVGGKGHCNLKTLIPDNYEKDTRFMYAWHDAIQWNCFCR